MGFALGPNPLIERRTMKRPKPISPRVHGMLDYSTAAAVAAAPRIMDLPAPASRLFETLAGGYTALSAVTVLEAGPWWVVFDAGPVCPDHLPGHGHADSLMIESSVQGERLFVDTGVSTYGVVATRDDRSGDPVPFIHPPPARGHPRPLSPPGGYGGLAAQHGSS